MKTTRIFAAIIILLSLAPVPAAAEGFIRWSIEPYTGLRWGSVSEFVFDTNTGKNIPSAPDGFKQMSRLDWTFAPFLVAGLKTSLEIKRVCLNFSAEGGIPLECGKMKDYDWLGFNGNMTHYSEHDNYLKRHFAVFFKGGWRFSFLDDRLSLIPSVGVNYKKTGFESRDGFTQYVNNSLEIWSPAVPKEEFSGKAVSYEQEVFAVTTSLDFSWKGGDVFTLKTGFELQPVVFVNGFDIHHQRNLKFLDWNMGGAGIFAFSGYIAGEWNLTSRLAFTAQGEWGVQPVVSGKSFGAEEDKEAYSKIINAKSGNSSWQIGISAGLRIRIF